MARSRAPRRLRVAVAVTAALLASGIAALVAPTPALAAYTTTGASFSGMGCSGNNTSSTWGWALAPANAVAINFTLTGAGGSGGDNNAGSGGRGGRGAIVTGSYPVDPGEYVWAIMGCGGLDGTGNAAGYSIGPARSNLSGGGGGSSGMCLGNSGGCPAGTMIAIAGGGGGGGRGSGTGVCSDKVGGAGGDAGNAGTGSAGGGTTYAGGGGGNGNGTPQAYGGGGGGTSPGAGGGGQGAGDAGSGGNGGLGNNGKNTIQAGSGGGGYAGGGGGGGGEDGACVGGNWASAGGGGAGSSWTRSGVTGISVTGAGHLGSCSVNTINSNPGGAASQGNQSWGCGGGLSATWTLGTAPTGADQTTGTATKGVALGINLANADAEGNSRTCELVSGVSKGSLSIDGGACTASYTAGANQNLNDSFTYRVRDSDNLVGPTYTVTIPIGNRNPVAANGSVNATKGTAAAVTLSNSDPDGDTGLTCEIVTGPTKGTVSSGTSCSRTYTGLPNGYGTDTFTYRVKDAFGGISGNATVTVTIQNRTPSATAQTVAVDAGSATAITLSGIDLDDDWPLTCATTGSPSKGALTGTGCSRSYTSNAGTANAGVGGSDSFPFTVSDGGPATSAAANVTINIANPNLSLTKAHTGRFNEGVGTGTYTLTVANTTTAPANGTTTVTDTLPAGMTYRSSNAGASGFSCSGTPGVSTTVTCTRGTQIAEGASLAFTITVDVAAGAASPLTNSAVVSSLYELASTAADNTASDPTDVNHRPTGADQTVSTDVDAAVLVTLAGTDPDGDALTFAIGTGPANGALSGSGATRQYVPNTGFQGVDTFTYTVTDTGTPGLVSVARTVTVYVGVSGLVGVVTDEVSGQPIAGVEARLVDMADPQAGVLKATVVTNASGAYDFGPVAFGTYGIRFVDPTNDHISEWFDDAPTSATANLFTLDASASSVAKSVALRPGGRVTGTVRSTVVPNAPIEGLQVRLVKIGSPGSQAKTTSAGGGYAFELLQPGSYQVWFRDLAGDGWISEWYTDAATQAESTVVEVAIGQQVTIDELIAPVAPPPPPDSGSVSGTVTDSVTGAPLEGVQVRLYKDPYTGSASATTDENGQYSFTRLAPASYRLWFRDMTGTRISEYGGDASTLAEADTLTLANNGEIVDAALTPKNVAPPADSGVISGSVLEVDGFTPIAGLQVRLYPVGGLGSRATATDLDGSYSFTGLAPGQYQVFFRDLTRTWYSEWHVDAPNQAGSTAVTAANGQTTDVDAILNRK